MKKILMLLFIILAMSVVLLAQDKSNDPSDFQTKSFTVQKDGLLEVEVEPGAVRIEPWEKDEVMVEAEG
ncbi:MAG: hypothetical protein EHM64_05505, partial [Ignavibacteriae bacterium]